MIVGFGMPSGRFGLSDVRRCKVQTKTGAGFLSTGIKWKAMKTRETGGENEGD